MRRLCKCRGNESRAGVFIAVIALVGAAGGIAGAEAGSSSARNPQAWPTFSSGRVVLPFSDDAATSVLVQSKAGAEPIVIAESGQPQPLIQNADDAPPAPSGSAAPSDAAAPVRDFTEAEKEAILRGVAPVAQENPAATDTDKPAAATNAAGKPEPDADAPAANASASGSNDAVRADERADKAAETARSAPAAGPQTPQANEQASAPVAPAAAKDADVPSSASTAAAPAAAVPAANDAAPTTAAAPAPAPEAANPVPSRNAAANKPTFSPSKLPKASDYWQKRASEMLKADGPNPSDDGLEQSYPEHTIVSCIAGCGPEPAKVVYMGLRKDLVVETAGEVVPTSADTNGDVNAAPASGNTIMCVAGCYDEPRRSFKIPSTSNINASLKTSAARHLDRARQLSRGAASRAALGKAALRDAGEVRNEGVAREPRSAAADEQSRARGIERSGAWFTRINRSRRTLQTE